MALPVYARPRQGTAEVFQAGRVNEEFLSHFYDWARVELTNHYNQVRMTKDQLSDPIAPPDETAHLFLVVQRFGLKWDYMKYQSLISACVVPTEVFLSCVHLGRDYFLSNRDNPDIMTLDTTDDEALRRALRELIFPVFGNNCICLHIIFLIIIQ